MEKKKEESTARVLPPEQNAQPTSGTGADLVDTTKEVDADDAIHQQETMPVVSGKELDEDELVHSMPEAETAVDINQEIDPDDLVHQKDELLPDQ